MRDGVLERRNRVRVRARTDIHVQPAVGEAFVCDQERQEARREARAAVPWSGEGRSRFLGSPGGQETHPSIGQPRGAGNSSVHKEVEGGPRWVRGGSAREAEKAKPAAFMHARNAILVETGNFDDDLPRIKDCDLIIEAVVERLDIKQALFEKLEKLAAPHAIIASNTSGLRIADMLVGRSEQFRKNFMVTHFFNPPRYMKLLELVAAPDTTADAKASAEAFGKNLLGKGIVWAKDTPNFIGNRIGLQSMMTTIHLMLEKGLAPEDIDAITGIPLAHPKSATFRTADVVGLDTVGHVAENCYKTLTNDESIEALRDRRRDPRSRPRRTTRRATRAKSARVRRARRVGRGPPTVRGAVEQARRRASLPAQPSRRPCPIPRVRTRAH